MAFWLWALDNAPDGNLTEISKKTIGFAAQFSKTPEKFVQAMISSGWFDNTDEGLKIHDWEDYAGRIVQKRADNKERMRNARAANVRRTDTERVGLPYPTVPYRTVPIYIETLRSIPGWEEKGKPYEDNLLLWVKRKSLTSDALERSAIGLAKVQEKTLKGYSNLVRAFQDRINKGYDQPNEGQRYGINRSNPPTNTRATINYDPGTDELGR